jgi:hypothetical protein
MTQVATSVFSQNGVVSSLPAAGTLLTTDATNVVAGGVASVATMTQIATSVYGNNAALTGLANASSVTATDTTVVAQSGTNREATVLQVGTSIFGNFTAAAGAGGTNTGATLLDVNGTTVIQNPSYTADTKTIYGVYRNFANSQNNLITTTKTQYGTSQLIACSLNIPLNSPTQYGIQVGTSAYSFSYTSMYAIIQSSRFATAGGAPVAKPTVGTTAQINIIGLANYPNDDTYLSYNLLNFNTATYGSGLNPTFKVPFKYVKGSATTVGSVTATGTGSIAGNIMTITVGPTGTNPRIVAGATVTGTGVVTGTKIVEQLTDTVGGGTTFGAEGTYLVNTAQTVASTTLTCTGVDAAMMGYLTKMEPGQLIVDLVSSNYASGAIDILIYGNQQLYRGST